MLSKPLALQSVRMHRPSFWQCERAGFEVLLSLHRDKKKKKTLCICWCRQIKWLWFRFFSAKWDPSAIIHSFPVWGAEPALGAFGSRYWFELRSCDYYSHCARTHRSHGGRKKYWAAPGVWAKLRKTHNGKNARICQYIHNIHTGALYHSHKLHKVFLS